MTEPELVRPSAGQLDVWSRLAGVGIVIGLVIGVIPPIFLGLDGVLAALLLTGLLVIPAALSLWLGLRASAAAKRERVAGYSTMYDFVGYELRDPRTLVVLRSADVRPSGLVRRSLFRAMLTVKPGTVLAQRLAEEDEADGR